MIFPRITLDRNMTPFDRVKAQLRRPSRARLLAGTRVGDMVALKRAIALCPMCINKFDVRRNGYVQRPTMPFVRGKCDGCRQHSDQNHFLFHKDAMPQ